MEVSSLHVIENLMDRITAIAVRTYEVEKLLKPKAELTFRRVGGEVKRAEQVSPSEVQFDCLLTLQAGVLQEGVAQTYVVNVSGVAAYERPVWRINELTDVLIKPAAPNS